jgi:hypothetical protein
VLALAELGGTPQRLLNRLQTLVDEAQARALQESLQVKSGAVEVDAVRRKPHV